MNYLTLDLVKARPVFTKHARERVMQRARLFLYQVEKDNLLWFLQKDFKKAKTDPRYVNCPFYSNMHQAYHGKNTFDCMSELLTYHCAIRDDGVLIVCTITLNKEVNKQ